MGKHRGPRSSGSVVVNAAKAREASVEKFKTWYYEESGDVLPDDMYAMFRKGFNMGWKAKNEYDRM